MMSKYYIVWSDDTNKAFAGSRATIYESEHLHDDEDCGILDVLNDRGQSGWRWHNFDGYTPCDKLPEEGRLTNGSIDLLTCGRKFIVIKGDILPMRGTLVPAEELPSEHKLMEWQLAEEAMRIRKGEG
jgi:hypothetical protein